MPDSCPLYELLQLPPDSKHLISHFVCLFTTSVSTTHLKEAWSTELNFEVSDDIWNEGLTRIQTCSINVRYELIQSLKSCIDSITQRPNYIESTQLFLHYVTDAKVQMVL